MYEGFKRISCSLSRNGTTQSEAGKSLSTFILHRRQTKLEPYAAVTRQHRKTYLLATEGLCAWVVTFTLTSFNAILGAFQCAPLRQDAREAIQTCIFIQMYLQRMTRRRRCTTRASARRCIVRAEKRQRHSCSLVCSSLCLSGAWLVGTRKSRVSLQPCYSHAHWQNSHGRELGVRR